MQRTKSGKKIHLNSSKYVTTEIRRNNDSKCPNFQMAKSCRNSNLKSREILGDRQIHSRYKIQSGKELIPQNILSQFLPHRKLESLAQEIRQMPDRLPECIKLNYFFIFEFRLMINKAPSWFF